MIRTTIAAFALGSVAALLVPSAASAEDGFTISDVNMRAGPATSFPVIATLPEGAGIYIHGCLSDWDWCDVSWSDERGWVFSDYLESLYGQRRVPIVEYRSRIGIPVLTFSVSTYWDRYYRDRYWYRDRDHWSNGKWRHDNDWSKGDNDRDRDWSKGDNDRDRDWSKGDNDRDRDWSKGDNDRDRDWSRGDNDGNRDWSKDDNDRGQRMGNRDDRNDDRTIGSGDGNKLNSDRDKSDRDQALDKRDRDQDGMRDDDDRTGSITKPNVDGTAAGQQTMQQRRGNQNRTGQDCDPTDKSCERD